MPATVMATGTALGHLPTASAADATPEAPLDALGPPVQQHDRPERRTAHLGLHGGDVEPVLDPTRSDLARYAERGPVVAEKGRSLLNRKYATAAGKFCTGEAESVLAFTRTRPAAAGCGS